MAEQCTRLYQARQHPVARSFQTQYGSQTQHIIFQHCTVVEKEQAAVLVHYGCTVDLYLKLSGTEVTIVNMTPSD